MRNLPWSQPGRFWKGNLHCHSTLSDGTMALPDVVAAYRTQGYDFVSVTDHFVVADTRPFRGRDFTTLLGAELHDDSTAIGTHLCINVIGVPPEFTAPRGVEPVDTMAQRALDTGAFVTFACPYWSGIAVEDVLRIPGIHAVETYSETCSGLNDRGDSWHLVDGAAARGRRLTGLAVDDAHFREWPDWFAAWVEVRAASLDPDALLDALKAGRFYSTQGPKILDLAIEDDHLRVTCTPARAVIFGGFGPGSDRAHGVALTAARVPVTQFQGSYVRVTVIGMDGKRAWSNPIWLD